MGQKCHRTRDALNMATEFNACDFGRIRVGLSRRSYVLWIWVKVRYREDLIGFRYNNLCLK